MAYEQKFDGHRMLVFTQSDPGGRVLLQTRRGSLVQDRFPDLVAAAAEQLPPGLVLDGEVLVWDPETGGLSFEGLQRRAAARARTAPALAARLPAYFVAFDVLQSEGGELLLSLPYRERRRRLEVLFAARGLTAPWTLCPMTTDVTKAREWLEEWTDVSGVEGLVIKPLSSKYLPAYPGSTWHSCRAGPLRSPLDHACTATRSCPPHRPSTHKSNSTPLVRTSARSIPARAGTEPSPRAARSVRGRGDFRLRPSTRQVRAD
ncbi:RNA ligase family protein [Streptomyces subrutilus]|uniref:ATP-dependent DNA ligase n=1 Tax=Streptomyces subrutilus TaxID=36818 RepID=UPI001FCAC31D|nr:RNA ligase family protein [Streptomyces subrutilus]